VSSLQGDVVHHIITHSQHLRLGKFVSSGPRTVLQHNPPEIGHRPAVGATVARPGMNIRAGMHVQARPLKPFDPMRLKPLDPSLLRGVDGRWAPRRPWAIVIAPADRKPHNVSQETRARHQHPRGPNERARTDDAGPEALDQVPAEEGAGTSGARRQSTERRVWRRCRSIT
jgi:hypothetical protein